MQRSSRFTILTRTVALLVFPVAVFATVHSSTQTPSHGHPASALSVTDALARLREGNARFAADEARHANAGSPRRHELANGQSPFAVIVTCSDSRVPPELLFDQGLGDLFVIRVAGNVVDAHALGSIEYAVDHLGTNVVVVLGHERCGAVAAARAVLAAGERAPGHVQSLVEAIAPAVAATRGEPADATSRANAERMVARIATESAPVRARAEAGSLRVLAAFYDLDTGVVTFAGE